jgi:hypothetical protein
MAVTSELCESRLLPGGICFSLVRGHIPGSQQSLLVFYAAFPGKLLAERSESYLRVYKPSPPKVGAKAEYLKSGSRRAFAKKHLF